MSWFERHGCRKYEKLPIWDVDWNRIAKQAGKIGSFKDPRGPISRLVHWWLKKTQPYHTRFRVRKIDDLLKKLGW